jgi:hypothetical protein
LKTLSAAAWVFAIFRALHSAVHCAFNLAMLPFYLYLVSTLAVWFMLARAAFAPLRRVMTMLQEIQPEGLFPSKRLGFTQVVTALPGSESRGCSTPTS